MGVGCDALRCVAVLLRAGSRAPQESQREREFRRWFVWASEPAQLSLALALSLPPSLLSSLRRS